MIRNGSIPPIGLPDNTLPTYALPALDVDLGSLRSLIISRGGVQLSNPGFVDEIVPIYIDEIPRNVQQRAAPRDVLGFRFRVQNPSGNPISEITDFNVTGDIYLFGAFNTLSTVTGVTLGASGAFDLCFFTTFNKDELQEGTNFLTGAWDIDAIFDGYPGITEGYIINITYRVILPGASDNGKSIPYGPGKIAPHAYIDEYTVLNKREPESFNSGRSRLPGNTN